MGNFTLFNHTVNLGDFTIVRNRRIPIKGQSPKLDPVTQAQGTTSIPAYNEMLEGTRIPLERNRPVKRPKSKLPHNNTGTEFNPFMKPVKRPRKQTGEVKIKVVKGHIVKTH